MIATVDIADQGVRSTLASLRHRPAPATVPGLRWLDGARRMCGNGSTAPYTPPPPVMLPL